MVCHLLKSKSLKLQTGFILLLNLIWLVIFLILVWRLCLIVSIISFLTLLGQFLAFFNGHHQHLLLSHSIESNNGWVIIVVLCPPHRHIGGLMSKHNRTVMIRLASKCPHTALSSSVISIRFDLMRTICLIIYNITMLLHVQSSQKKWPRVLLVHIDCTSFSSISIISIPLFLLNLLFIFFLVISQCLSFVLVKRFEVNEVLWEILKTVKGEKIC